MEPDLRAIVRTAVELTSRHDQEAVLDAILAELERLVPYDMASVLVLEGEWLRPLAARGFRRDVVMTAQKYGVGTNVRLDRALAARGTVRFTNPDEPDPFDGLGHTQLGHLHSCMAAPMRLEGRLLGLITADAHRPDAFGVEHEERIELFAALAAVAIRNAHLVGELDRAKQKREGEVAQLAAEIRAASGGIELVGSSGPIVALREEIAAVGPTDTNVLILGETGTGKELIARALHAASARRERPLIRFDCSAVAPTLVESELYGHSRGAFTGAGADRPGKFEVADGSTLFLDEVGELPMAVQPRLLRALQEREVERLGEHRVRRFDVRVIAATNRDLTAQVERQRFRADLFHRLAVYPIRAPTLAERLDDLPELVNHFSRRFIPRLRLERVRVEPPFLEALRAYPWPGNVRELENTIERALVRERARGHAEVVLDGRAARELGLASTEATTAPIRRARAPVAVSLAQATAEFQRELIERTLKACGGSLAEAARLLGEDRSNLRRRWQRLQRAR
jgi:anaerobic nitric oxide reductase transcription regulator